MTATVIWHGDLLESAALVAAVEHNCACKFGLMGVRISTCPPHESMVRDQRFMDGLVFMRRKAACLQREEWAAKPANP